MPMAINSKISFSVAAKPQAQNKSLESIEERREHIASVCDLNAKALDKGWLAEDRKANGLPRAWYTESNGKFFITVRNGSEPVMFYPGMTAQNNSLAFRSAKDAAEMYREISASVRKGELDSEILAAVAASKAIAAKRGKAKVAERAPAKGKADGTGKVGPNKAK